MKTNLATFIFTITLSFSMMGQQPHSTYQDGEWLKFRIHYGWFNASFATLSVEETTLNNTPVYHVTGHGKSTGLLDLFFKVDDTYETFINKKTHLPIKFIRNINEGGYKKNKVIYFNQQNNQAVVHDKLRNTRKTFTTKNKAQDLLSAYYLLRGKINSRDLNIGDEIVLNMFFDNENYKFISKYLGRDILETKFGDIACLKFRPIVQAGRVFEEKESLTVWVSADKNHVPVKIKAELAVGSLEADLVAFKGLKHPFKIIIDN